VTRRACRIAAVAVLVVGSGTMPRAATKYAEVEPGWSTKADAIRALGEPTESLTSFLLECSPQAGTGPIFVELRTDGSDVVDRIEVRFTAALARQALADALKLPPEPDAIAINGRGGLVEYYGNNLSIVLTYDSRDTSGGAVSIGYDSDALFERELDRAKASGSKPPAGGDTAPGTSIGGAAGGGVPPGPPSPPPVNTVPPSIRRDPLACYGVYVWAQREEDAARKAKQRPRRQMAADISIAAQSGDCDRAKKLVDDYRKQFGGSVPRVQ
jgi:hypothetical protein